MSGIYLSRYADVERMHQSSKGLKLSDFVSLKGDAWQKRDRANRCVGGVELLTSLFSMGMI